MFRLVPNSATVVSGVWTGVPPMAFGDEWQRVNDSIVVPPDDAAGMLTSNVLGAAQIVFGFPWPAYMTLTTYGDGTSPVSIPGVTSVTTHYRIRTVGGPGLNLANVVRRGGTSYNDTAAAYNSSAWASVTKQWTTDPATGAAWTADNVRQTQFGLSKSGGVELDLTQFYVVVEESEWIGGTKARLGPAQGEPSYFCAICSVPFHLSKLIKPSDPIHPQYGRLVCSDCYDEITQYELPEQGLKEGDLDFET